MVYTVLSMRVHVILFSDEASGFRLLLFIHVYTRGFPSQEQYGPRPLKSTWGISGLETWDMNIS